MMSNKIYTWILVLSLNVPLAEATPLVNCLRWLQPSRESVETQDDNSLAPHQTLEYINFRRERARNPYALPKTAKRTVSTSPDLLTTSFFYWWYPGNVYAALMVPENRELAEKMLAGEDHIPPEIEATPADFEGEVARRIARPIRKEFFPKLEDARAELPLPAHFWDSHEAGSKAGAEFVNFSDTKDKDSGSNVAVPFSTSPPTVSSDPATSFGDPGGGPTGSDF